MEFLDVVLHIDRYLDTVQLLYGPAVYAVLFGILFFEMAFLPCFILPGNTLLFICGAFCATGEMNVWIVMLLLIVAAVLGSMINYRLGSLAGRKVFVSDYRWLNKSALDRTHAFYERWGSITFIVSPYIGVVRTFAPFVAGVSAMTPGKFRLFMMAGIALWVVTAVPAGYYFGHIPFIREHLNAIMLGGIAIGVGSLLLGVAWRFGKSLLVK